MQVGEAMLGVLLTILKVILILIGVILGIVVLILAVLLFNFCRFEAQGSKNEDIKSKGSFRWLFGIVKGSYDLDGDHLKYSVYVPFGICNINYDSEGDNINIDLEEKNICNNDENIHKTVANIEKNGNINSIVKKIKNFFTGIKNFIAGIADKINFARSFNDKYSIRSILNATIKLIIRLLKNIGFKKCEINGIIGLGDPSDTGKAIGAVAVGKAFVPLDINIEGNFEERELTGDFNIRGRTNLWLILFPIAKYIFTKPVWPLVKDYWKGEFDG